VLAFARPAGKGAGEADELSEGSRERLDYVTLPAGKSDVSIWPETWIHDLSE
jgi:hypothetical protein